MPHDPDQPSFRRGVPISLSKMRRIEEAVRGLEQFTTAGDGGIVGQADATGIYAGWNTSPGYLGFPAQIIGQDPFFPWLYSFRSLIETPTTVSTSQDNPSWINDNTFFLYPANTYNAMEGNLRVDVPWAREPFLEISNAATANGVAELTIGGGPLVVSGTTASGNTTITDVSPVVGLSIGQSITGTGIPANTTITNVSLNGAIVWMTPSAVPDFFSFYYFERVMIIEITGVLITDTTNPGYGYYPGLEKIFNTASRTWTDGDTCYWRDANQ